MPARGKILSELLLPLVDTLLLNGSDDDEDEAELNPTSKRKRKNRITERKDKQQTLFPISSATKTKGESFIFLQRGLLKSRRRLVEARDFEREGERRGTGESKKKGKVKLWRSIFNNGYGSKGRRSAPCNK